MADQHRNRGAETERFCHHLNGVARYGWVEDRMKAVETRSSRLIGTLKRGVRYPNNFMYIIIISYYVPNHPSETEDKRLRKHGTSQQHGRSKRNNVTKLCGNNVMDRRLFQEEVCCRAIEAWKAMAQ